jgi:hypothetical protein
VANHAYSSAVVEPLRIRDLVWIVLAYIRGFDNLEIITNHYKSAC